MKKNNNEVTTKTVIGIVAGIILLIVIILLLMKGCNADKKYTVTFDSNGGSIVDKLTVKENENIKRPKDPTKKGYVFIGWYYKDKLFKFNTKITKNIKLEARWKLDTGISLSIEDLMLEIGDESVIEIASLPKGVKLKDLIWTSSDKNIVTVDKNGKIKALKAGKVTITVKTKDGKYKAKCTITVQEYGNSETNNNENTTNYGSAAKKSTSSEINENNGNTQSTPGSTKPTTKYVITITEDVQEVTNNVARYYFSVTENGSTITNYKAFKYNNRPVKPNSGTITSVNIDKTITSVDLILNNGSTVKASVIYK